MKKLLILMMLTAPVAAFSQSSMLDRFKQKVKNRIDQRVDQGMDKTIDKAEEEITKKPELESGENEVEEKVTASTSDAKAEKRTTASLQSSSRYDFIPGENILYNEDFSQDAIGELPLKWATNNRGETVTIESIPNKWMRLFPGSRFASPALKQLPQNFTVEMDLMLQVSGESVRTYPEVQVKLTELLPSDANARSYVKDQYAENELSLVLTPGGAEKPLNVSLESDEKGINYFSNPHKVTKTISDNSGKPIHIAIWVQKERVRYWINGDKVFDIPQAVPAKAIFNRIGYNVESSLYEEHQLGIYVSNIKVAEGTPDMRSKLMTEGKLVTHGILFDVNSDKIKPESAGVLKEIAAVLKENPTVKVKVIGHTDSDGEDAKNLDLSKRRSASVKGTLAEDFGIDAARMETDGLGESKPAADNTSNEGKAQNRRVEFIKL
jgi:outer membrane protein OmpA-like peptidoglycan-associated protein